MKVKVNGRKINGFLYMRFYDVLNAPFKNISVRKIKFGIFILTFIFNFTTNVLLARDVCEGL